MSLNRRQLAGGRTVYDVRLRDPSGRQYKRTFRTKRQAETFVASERVEQSRGAWVDPRRGQILLAEYSTNWLRTRPEIRIRTYQLYEGTLRRLILPAFGEVELSSISSVAIREWYSALSERGFAQSTCAKAYRLLRTILNTAVDDGLIAKNPCKIKGGGVARSPERPIATVEQVSALADAIDARYRVAVLLATYGGLRLGELLALNRDRIDVHAGTVEVIDQLQELADGAYFTAPPKTDAGRRTVSLPDFMKGELHDHLSHYAEQEGEGWLFRGMKGGPLRRAVLYRAWDEARRKVGVSHLHFHDLRHTGNTLAAATGASTRELMVRMGHSSSEAALRYQHATRERDQAIASRLHEMVAGSHPEANAGGAAQPEVESADATPAAAALSVIAAEGSNVRSLDAYRASRPTAQIHDPDSCQSSVPGRRFGSGSSTTGGRGF